MVRDVRVQRSGLPSGPRYLVAGELGTRGLELTHQVRFVLVLPGASCFSRPSHNRSPSASMFRRSLGRSPR